MVYYVIIKSRHKINSVLTVVCFFLALVRCYYYISISNKKVITYHIIIWKKKSQLKCYQNLKT